MKHLIAISAIILLTGCSASYHIKKARRLDPSLFQTKTIVQHDTTVIETPVFLDKVQIDTLVEIVQTDPVTLRETVIKYKIAHDTIMIECPDSEVITIVETKTETITIKPTFWEKVQWSIYIIIGLVVFLVVKRFPNS